MSSTQAEDPTPNPNWTRRNVADLRVRCLKRHAYRAFRSNVAISNAKRLTSASQHAMRSEPPSHVLSHATT